MERGAAWLAATQRADGSWDEPQFTGTGFPGDFYINYHLYRLAFPVSALGRYVREALRRTRLLRAGPTLRAHTGRHEMTKPIHSPPLAPGGAPSAPGMPRPGQQGDHAPAAGAAGRNDGAAPLLVCAPLLFEARAVRRGLRDSARAGGGASRADADPPTVMRTGYGPARAARHAEKVRQGPFGMLAITGTGAGLAPDLSPATSSWPPRSPASVTRAPVMVPRCARRPRRCWSASCAGRACGLARAVSPPSITWFAMPNGTGSHEQG